jgi:hypothetical protein
MRMDFPGRVQNGVVVLESGPALPEGVAVTIPFPAVPQAKPASEKRRIQIPLVRTGEAGSVQLTNARVAQILDQEDAGSRH